MKMVFCVMGVVLSVGFVGAACEFLAERSFGKVDVLNVVSFDFPRRNKCLTERGPQVGKIHFRYEPEGTFDVFEFVGYFDLKTQCFDAREILMNCAEVPVGSILKNVGFIEKDPKGREKRRGRGIITRLFIVP
jgi:hypothetical protein